MAMALSTLLQSQPSSAMLAMSLSSSVTLRQWRCRRASSTFAPGLRNQPAALHAHAAPPSPLPPRAPSSAQRLHPGPRRTETDVRYSHFLALLGQRRIEKVIFNEEGTQLIGQLRPAKRRWGFRRTDARTRAPPRRIRIRHLPNDPVLLDTLADHGVDISVSSADFAGRPRGLLSSTFRRLLFPFSLVAGLLFLYRRGASSSPLALAKMTRSFDFRPRTNVTFDDVAGCDGAKRELAEVVDFLRQPRRYTDMGCVIPRGVMLHGPPGTGKTLLAKAVAGEAEVPFVSISGSEFVELYVGAGASRVRELFFQAKKEAPCIVFIDELDSVGRQRGAGHAGGNDEREQTINQILVEMDGFKGNTGVITMAATNRLDVLDDALLRPGRFDRKVEVDLPDVRGRTRILSVHARGKPLAPDVDLEAVARRTPGFSGAELANLMNEAALSAAREGEATIDWMAVDGALDRLLVGMEKRGGTAMLSPEQVEIVAYHEAGHAICGALIPVCSIDVSVFDHIITITFSVALGLRSGAEDFNYSPIERSGGAYVLLARPGTPRVRIVLQTILGKPTDRCSGGQGGGGARLRRGPGHDGRFERLGPRRGHREANGKGIRHEPSGGPGGVVVSQRGRAVHGEEPGRSPTRPVGREDPGESRRGSRAPGEQRLRQSEDAFDGKQATVATFGTHARRERSGGSGGVPDDVVAFQCNPVRVHGHRG